MSRRQDKVALITGAACGTGAATARRYLASDESSFCTGADFPVDAVATAGTVLASMPKP